MIFTLSIANEPAFVSGKIYRFKYSATNIIGEGLLSTPISIALAANA